MNDLYDEMLDDADNNGKKDSTDDEKTYVGPVRHPIYNKQFNEGKCDLTESRIISAYAEFREDIPDSDAYQRDRNKLIDLLYRYVLDYDRYVKTKYRLDGIETYGMEIFEVSSDCLASYSREPDGFLIYFNYSLNRKLSRAHGLNAYNATHHSIKSPIKPEDFDELNEFKPGYDKVISDPGKTDGFDSEEEYKNNSSGFDNPGTPADDESSPSDDLGSAVSEEAVPDASYESDPSAAGGSALTVDDVVNSMTPDKFDLFMAFLNDHNYTIEDALFFWNGVDRGTLSDDNDNETELYTVLPDNEHFEQTIQLLDVLEQVYDTELSEGRKKRYSMIITSLILCPVHKMPGVLEVFKSKDYFDDDVYSHFMTTGNVPDETWIADFLGKKLPSISRDLATFRKIISEVLKRSN